MVRSTLVLLLAFVVLITFWRHQASVVRESQQIVRVAQASSEPVPRPSASGCAMSQQMYPPTQHAFDEQHLSAKQQAEVRKWVSKMSADDRRYAKWWIAPSSEYGPTLLVFSAKPLTGGDEAWTAVNTNILINVVACDYYPYPGA